MSRKVSVGAAVSIAAIAAAVAVSLTYTYAMNLFNRKVADVNEREAMYTKLSEVDRKTRTDYVGTIDEKAVTDGICAGYLAALGDPHTKYLTAKQYQAYLNSSDTVSTGVGIRTIRDSDGNMEIVEVDPGSPAEKAGLKKGDTVLQLNGKDVVRITYAEAVQQLDGAAGSTVSFRLLRPQEATPASSASSSASSAPSAASADSSASSAAPQKTEQTLDVTVTRGEYTRHTVDSSLINGNAAYLRISRFSENTAEDFNSALSSLVRRDACGLVIDLRGNTGGSMKAAAAVLDTLLPAGTTVQSRDRSGTLTVEYASGANEVTLPVSVITDAQTSGAAELFAADIRDFKKGLVVGTATAGSGAKETAVPLSDGSAMILSTAEYLSAGGKTFEGTGISPDIEKDLTDDQKTLLERMNLSPAEDAQVQTAVTALQRQGAAVKELPGTPPSGNASESAKD